MRDVDGLIKSLALRDRWERKDTYAAIAREYGEGFANVIEQRVEALVRGTDVAVARRKERSQKAAATRARMRSHLYLGRRS